MVCVRMSALRIRLAICRKEKECCAEEEVVARCSTPLRAASSEPEEMRRRSNTLSRWSLRKGVWCPGPDSEWYQRGL